MAENEAEPDTVMISGVLKAREPFERGYILTLEDPTDGQEEIFYTHNMRRVEGRGLDLDPQLLALGQHHISATVENHGDMPARYLSVQEYHNGERVGETRFYQRRGLIEVETEHVDS